MTGLNVTNMTDQMSRIGQMFVILIKSLQNEDYTVNVWRMLL